MEGTIPQVSPTKKEAQHATIQFFATTGFIKQIL